MPRHLQRQVLQQATRTDADLGAMRREWRIVGRPNQQPPVTNWRTWLVLAGRGFGKTRTGAEWVRAQVEQHGRQRVAIVGATAADARDVMVEGESGILAVAPRLRANS